MQRGAPASTYQNEYYRLACECSDAYTDSFGNVYNTANNFWQVHYFSDNACLNNVASSDRFYSGACGSASSVSVSLFASLAVAFVALKNM